MKVKKFLVKTDASGLPHNRELVGSDGMENLVGLSGECLCWMYWMLGKVEVSYTYTLDGRQYSRQFELLADLDPKHRVIRPARFEYEREILEEDRYLFANIEFGNVSGSEGSYGLRFNLSETDEDENFFLESLEPESDYRLLDRKRVAFGEAGMDIYLSTLEETSTGSIQNVTLTPYFYEVESG